MNIWVSNEHRSTAISLTAEEVRRAIARAAVEKANAVGLPYLWSERVDVFGLSGEGGVTAVLRDGRECHVALARLGQ